jgi:opacity protein-like surface antigen
MKANMNKFLAVLLCLAGFALPQLAATSANASTLDRGTNELGVWAGYSPTNPTLIGTTTDRPFFELNIQYARVLLTGRNWAFKYMIELAPVAIISQPRQHNVVQGGQVFSADLPGSSRNIYGGGISPIGLQLNFRRRHSVQPYVNGTAGILYFTDQVPVSNSSQFNFAVSWGGGVQIWAREKQSLSLGYKFHHISNANSASRNPGVDSNIFYAGYSWSWKR